MVASGRNPDLHKPTLAEARLRRYDPADLLQGLTVNNLHRRLAQEGDKEIAAVIGKGHPLRLNPHFHSFDLGKQGTRRIGLKMQTGVFIQKEGNGFGLYPFPAHLQLVFPVRQLQAAGGNRFAV